LRAKELSGNELELFSSPWSAPAWMKVTNRMKGGGPMKPGEQYKAAYAKYFRR
jgi:glucosylceramidase